MLKKKTGEKRKGEKKEEKKAGGEKRISHIGVSQENVHEQRRKNHRAKL